MLPIVRRAVGGDRAAGEAAAAAARFTVDAFGCSAAVGSRVDAATGDRGDRGGGASAAGGGDASAVGDEPAERAVTHFRHFRPFGRSNP